MLPFCVSTTGDVHSPAAMVSVLVALLAVAAATYSGLDPAGMVALQPLVRPAMPPVEKVKVAAADGSAGALVPRW